MALLLFALLLTARPSWSQGTVSKRAVLVTLREISELQQARAALNLPVEIKATVGYSNALSHMLYVQEDGRGLYVCTPDQTPFQPGDRVEVRGLTQPGVHPYVLAHEVVLIRHGPIPQPIPARYEDLIHQQLDGQLVSVRGRILTADIVQEKSERILRARILVGGDRFTIRVDEDRNNRLSGLIDAEVQVVGVSASRQADKTLQSASYLRVASTDAIQVLKLPEVDPWSIALSPFRDVAKSYHVQFLTRRVHVRGTLVYFRQGEVAVLQSGNQSLWVDTLADVPVQLGEEVDAIGFPDLSHGLLTLVNAELKPLGIVHPLLPLPTTWPQLSSERNLYDLVSIEGRVVSISRSVAQDDYILMADGAAFSASLRHSSPLGTMADIKRVEPGSLVRVTGICYADTGKPYDRQQAFGILMRSPEDIALLRNPSWFNASHLVALVGLLSVILIVAAIWAWVLSRSVHEKSMALARRVAADAAFERRMTQLEARRSRILEDINGTASLSSILEEISDLVSLHLNGVPCWCEVVDGARLGNALPEGSICRVACLEIAGRNGMVLGKICAAFAGSSQATEAEVEALTVGVRVAALAIETRRVYSDLRHRSEYDLLTDVPNRFLLNHNLERMIEEARQDARIFGLIYIDLDDFKRINDDCGHQVGDRYLQEAAVRMKHQLRGRDMLARIGGDEFAALVAAVRSRAEVDEIAQRLERCLDEEIVIGHCRLRGSASVGIAMYPEDAATIDGLLTAADASMYVAKNMRRGQKSDHTAKQNS